MRHLKTYKNEDPNVLNEGDVIMTLGKSLWVCYKKILFNEDTHICFLHIDEKDRISSSNIDEEDIIDLFDDQEIYRLNINDVDIYFLSNFINALEIHSKAKPGYVDPSIEYDSILKKLKRIWIRKRPELEAEIEIALGSNKYNL